MQIITSDTRWYIFLKINNNGGYLTERAKLVAQKCHLKLAVKFIATHYWNAVFNEIST